MQITEIGRQALLMHEDAVSLPSGMPDMMLLMLHAPAFLTLGDVRLTADGGDTVLVQKATPLRLTAAQGDLLYDFLCFDTGKDSGFYQSLRIPENVLLRSSDPDFLAALTERLCAEFYGNSQRRSDMLDCLLRALLIRLSETGGTVTAKAAAFSDPHYAELVRLREKIYANPQEKWTVEMLCSEVNMSRSYFQLIYRETFGMTCIADVINCKMNRARDLLTATGFTISHIAQLCGYDNEEHFMRQFKKLCGVTPTVYRREHRES